MTLKEQIQNRCAHFNGIMNKCCKAGIDYDVFRGNERPFKFPCLKQGGKCAKAEFMTAEQAENEAAEIDKGVNATINSVVKIQTHYTETHQSVGKIPCDCGGNLSYRRAESNGHIWAKCDTCTINFMQ